MPDFGIDAQSISDVFGFTAGSVVFAGTGGVFSQDNTNFSFDDSTNTLLVGGNYEWKSGTSFKGILDHANSANRTYTFPDYDGTMATLAGTETLTNKTLTSPTINGATLSGTLAGTPTISGAWTWSSGQTFPSITTNSDITMAAGAKLILDGGAGGTTYIDQSSDVIRLYAAATNSLSVSSSQITATVDISLAGNKLKTTTFQLWETGSVLYMQPQAAPDQMHLALRPPASGADVIFTVSRLNDVSTDYEYMRLASGGGGAWTFSQLAGGAGSLRGLNFVMGATTYLAVATTGAMTLGANLTFSGFKIIGASEEMQDSIMKSYASGNVGGYQFNGTGANDGGAIAVVSKGSAARAQVSVFSTEDVSTNYEDITLAKDASGGYIDVRAGGTGTVRDFILRSGGQAVITAAYNAATPTVNAHSRTWSNFIAASPTFSGTVSMASAAQLSFANENGDKISFADYMRVGVTAGGVLQIYTANAASNAAVSRMKFGGQQNAGNSYVIVSEPMDIISIRDASETVSITMSATAATLAGGDLSIGANKIKTTNLLIKELDANTFVVRNAADSAYKSIQGQTIDVAQLKAQDGTSAINIADTTGAMNFNSRAVSGFKAGAHLDIDNFDLQDVATLYGKSDTGNLDIASGPVNTGIIRLYTKDGGGSYITRMTLNANAAVGAAGITSYEPLTFSGLSGAVTLRTGRLQFRDDALEEYATNANSQISINYAGYNSGTTQFRDLLIADGKTNTIVFVDGSANSVNLSALTKLYLDGGGDTYIHESAANQLQLVAAGTAMAQADSTGFHAKAVQKAGAAVAGDTYEGFFTVVKDTSGGTVKLIYNDSGVLKSVTLT